MKYISILAVFIFSLGTVSFADSSQKQKRHNSKECNAKVIHSSSGAVGNPCLTTEEFVKSLDLNPQQKRNWQYLAENKQLVGKKQEKASH